MSDEYDEIIVNIGDMKDGDLVLGTDGEWHSIKLLPIQTKTLYKVNTSLGSVASSYDHYWVIFDDDGDSRELSTVELYGSIKQFKGCYIGVSNGAKLLSIDMLDEGRCRCIEVQDSDDHQFMIYTDTGNTIFTRNCQQRIVCGQLGSMASQMALGNSLATTIDGSHKGAGIISANNVISNCQYYFEDTKWIEKWYADRGMDRNGYPIGESSNNGADEEDISLGDDDEELSITDSDQHFEFEDKSKDVINRKEQKFENL